MPAVRKPNLKGSSHEAMAARARWAGQHSPYRNMRKMQIEDPERAAAFFQKGAAASHESKKRRKTLASLMRNFLDQPAAANVAKAYGLDTLFPDIPPEQITFGMLLTASVAMRGVSEGQGSQFAVIRDTIGEKPKDSIQVTGEDGAPLHPPSVNVVFQHAKKDGE